MSFYVVSDETGAPLEGISINVNEGSGIRELGKTGADGRCSVEIPYFRNEPGPYMSIQDPASAYMTRDTMLADLREREILIELVPAE